MHSYCRRKHEKGHREDKSEDQDCEWDLFSLPEILSDNPRRRDQAKRKEDSDCQVNPD